MLAMQLRAVEAVRAHDAAVAAATGTTPSGWRSRTATSSRRCSPTPSACTSTPSSGSSSTRARCRSSGTRRCGPFALRVNDTGGDLAGLVPPRGRAGGRRAGEARPRRRRGGVGRGRAAVATGPRRVAVMPRQVFDYDPPERFVAGTVGEPGSRTFFLQARSGTRVTSVALEKAQVVGARRARRRTARRGAAASAAARRRSPPWPRSTPRTTSRSTTPIEEEFRVGAMSLAWDPDAGRVVVECFAEGVVGRGRRGRRGRRRRARGRRPAGEHDRRRRARLHQARARSRGRRPAAVPVLQQPARPGGPHLPARQRLPALTVVAARPRPEADARLDGDAARDPRPRRARGAGPHRRRQQRHPARARWSSTGSRRSACTSRSRGSGRCGTSRAARWPTARSPRTCSSSGRRLGRSCRRPSCGRRTLRPGQRAVVDRGTRTTRRRTPTASAVPRGAGRRGGRRRAARAGAAGLAARRRGHGLGRRARSCSSTPTTPRCGGWRCSTSSPTTPTARAGTSCAAPTAAVFGVDHGLTFNEDDKLRTVLWGWAGRALTDEAVEVLGRLAGTSTATDRCGAACSTCSTGARCSGRCTGCRRCCAPAATPGRAAAARRSRGRPSDPGRRERPAAAPRQARRACPRLARRRSSAQLPAGPVPPGLLDSASRGPVGRVDRGARPPLRLRHHPVRRHAHGARGHLRGLRPAAPRLARRRARRTRYVQNVTDVDDPLLERAAATGVDWRDLAADQTQLFADDMAALRVLPPDVYEGAIEAIPRIVDAGRAAPRRGRGVPGARRRQRARRRRLLLRARRPRLRRGVAPRRAGDAGTLRGAWRRPAARRQEAPARRPALAGGAPRRALVGRRPARPRPPRLAHRVHRDRAGAPRRRRSTSRVVAPTWSSRTTR